MSLVWREQLSVSNNVIDNDHKYLINQIEESLKGGPRDRLADLLDNLTQYAKTHFVTEEKIAFSVGYVRVKQLKDSHKALMKELEKIKREIFDSEDIPSFEHITNFLRDWLLNHVIKEDLLMKPSLKKHAPTYDPR